MSDKVGLDKSLQLIEENVENSTIKSYLMLEVRLKFEGREQEPQLSE
ncbi:unnamed protein product [Soboliphyme baturini]|uniref:Phage protein n=1 Tax=Soboliphyme baturini TaxID=241478 RepID=A0A183J178_9BILA|nr:unnamed protein product [Soboliphyme baturini]